MTWKDGRLVRAELLSRSGNPVMLRTAGVVSIHRTDDTRVSAELRDGVVCFATEPGARYIIET